MDALRQRVATSFARHVAARQAVVPGMGAPRGVGSFARPCRLPAQRACDSLGPAVRRRFSTASSRSWAAGSRGQKACSGAARSDGGIVFIVAAVGGLTAWATPWALGRFFEACIERFDVDILGVDVEIGRLRVYPISGVWVYDGFEVRNPPGFHQKNVMSARRLVVDFDMRKLIRSRGKQVEVERLRFDDMCFYLEYNEGKCNIEVVSELHSAAGPPSQREDRKTDEAKKKQQSSDWVFHKVDVKDAVIVYGFGNSERRFKFGDVSYADFANDVGDSAIEEALHFIMDRLIKTVMSEIMGLGFVKWFNS
eukprot:TRINITY_DN27077_c0_g1_i1.p1 TRINITY_DN27077_c0_g1~~TRINITY_DN27077_c0_g1_i1.p1  ORF type:complete len:309 (-),score=70.71 TRINITY_DN27077_c0_g1_i1:75-1001(-)